MGVDYDVMKGHFEERLCVELFESQLMESSHQNGPWIYRGNFGLGPETC